MKKGVWKEYFIFSKKERTAVIILLMIIAVFIALPFYYSANKEKPFADTALQKQIAQLQQNASAGNPDTDIAEDSIEQGFQPNENISREKISLFYFDPNTLDKDGWEKLGVSDKTIHTIQNYLGKGGRFYKPEDIKKIYGLSNEKAAQLIPFVQIKNEEKNFQPEVLVKKDSVVTSSQKIFSAKKFSVININTATAEQWKTLPGIGDVLGNRIVKFRNKLGGFHSIDDVKKTYGLSDSVFQNIKPYLILQ